MRSAEAKVIIAYLVTACVQLTWHWWLAKSDGLAEALLHGYLAHDARVGKGVAGWFDLIIPCVCLGLIIGSVGAEWPIRKLAAFVLGVAAGLVALLPVYAYLLNGRQVWWWPTLASAQTMWFGQKIIQAICVVGVFTYGARGFVVYLRGNASGG